MTDDAAVHLAETFGELARSLLAEPDVDATLRKVVDMAVSTLDRCEHAGITLVEKRSIHSAAATDAVPAAIDRIQDEVDEGPCYDAIRERGTFRTGHLPDEDRWPHFCRRAHEETGVKSVLSLRLFAEADTLGALNLYSKQRDAFDDDDVAIGSVFAAHAAVALYNERETQQLRHAIQGRDIIGQAKGIIMAREKVTDDEAFTILRRASQHLNVKLRKIAERVAETGETPSPDGLGADG